VLLNFWAALRRLEEMPYLDVIAKVRRQQARDARRRHRRRRREDDQRHAQEVGVTVSYPLLTDEEFLVTDAYTNFLVPLTIVIDKGGVVRYIHTGFEKGTEKQYEDAARKALGL
jgi:hypothetical protein